MGPIWDPQAAAKAYEAGVGATLELALAGGSGVPGDAPLAGRFVVEHLADGRVRFDGPMMNGMWTEIGPVACLRIDGVRIAVSSVKMQIFDRNLYRAAGIQAERMKILVNKSSVHYRADFDAIALRASRGEGARAHGRRSRRPAVAARRSGSAAAPERRVATRSARVTDSPGRAGGTFVSLCIHCGNGQIGLQKQGGTETSGIRAGVQIHPCQSATSQTRLRDDWMHVPLNRGPTQPIAKRCIP